MKRCSSCKVEKEESDFRTRKTPYCDNYVVARCRKCELVINKQQADKDRRRRRENERNSDPEKRVAKNNRQKLWRKENIDKNRKYHSKHIKKHVDVISDSYIVRNHFRGFRIDHVPQELISSLREVIKVKRLIKNKK